MKTNAQFSRPAQNALDEPAIRYRMPAGCGTQYSGLARPGDIHEQAAAGRMPKSAGRPSPNCWRKGVVIVSWVWRARQRNRSAPLVNPKTQRGMRKVRGGSKEMDIILKAAGASRLRCLPTEIYAAIRTGAADAMTSSTGRHLVPPGGLEAP